MLLNYTQTLKQQLFKHIHTQTLTHFQLFNETVVLVVFKSRPLTLLNLRLVRSVCTQHNELLQNPADSHNHAGVQGSAYNDHVCTAQAKKWLSASVNDWFLFTSVAMTQGTFVAICHVSSNYLTKCNVVIGTVWETSDEKINILFVPVCPVHRKAWKVFPPY